MFVYHLINFFSLGFGFYFVCSLQKWCYINQISYPWSFFWYSFCSHSHCSICEESRCAFKIYTLCEQWAKSGNMRKNRYKYKKDQDMCLEWLWCLEFQVSRWARKKTHRNKRCHHFDVVSSHSVLYAVWINLQIEFGVVLFVFLVTGWFHW